MFRLYRTQAFKRNRILALVESDKAIAPKDHAIPTLNLNIELKIRGSGGALQTQTGTGYLTISWTTGNNQLFLFM